MMNKNCSRLLVICVILAIYNHANALNVGGIINSVTT